MKTDVLIIGAGAAGMMCAIKAAERGRRVILLDHGEKLGKKILISGGGRCNFTNIGASASSYVSANEHFCKSALARFTPNNFLELVHKHKIKYHEKKLGQLFCDHSAQNIVDMLKNELNEAGAQLFLNAKVLDVSRIESGNLKFQVKTENEIFECESLVFATGGPSIPKIGASDFGYRWAKKFGLKLTELSPALVSLTMGQEFQRQFAELSGVSLDAKVSIGKASFRENILITHLGLSGPAILQASLYWKSGSAIYIDLLPDENRENWLLEEKKTGVRQELKNLLSSRLTKKFAEKFCEVYLPSQPLYEIADAKLRAFTLQLRHWELYPVDTGGYGRAEVTRGGIDTNELSSKSMEVKSIPGMYFIGELVDVTGMLGGYNFQWAWASGAAAGSSV